MSDPVAPEVPTEAEILTGPEGFDIDQWKFAVAAGKYDNHLIEMASHLMQRAISDNRRRWRIRWRDDEITEDEFTLTAAAHAEEFTGIPWGVMNMSMGLDVQMNAKVAQGLLYGMARTRFQMDDRQARKAVDLPASQLIDVLDYIEVEPAGKGGSDQ